jgi:hypothetical protein
VFKAPEKYRTGRYSWQFVKKVWLHGFGVGLVVGAFVVFLACFW